MPESRTRRATRILVPAVIIAVTVLGWFTFRTTFQVQNLGQRSVLEASLGLAGEKADRLDKEIIAQDNVVSSVVDLGALASLESAWLPTATRETPTVRAILVLDAHTDVLAFASRGGAWDDDQGFRRALVGRMFADMELAAQPEGELRHLHRVYGGQSYLVSYWQKTWQGRRFVVCAWHDIGRIVKYTFPRLFPEAVEKAASRINVVDEEGRIIFGPPLRTSQFTVGVRFPTTLYGWRLQVSPSAGDELASRTERQRVLELGMVGLACIVIVAGIVTILVASERERRISAMKSDFVANVSHELKTPLALIRMFGEMLQSGRVTSEEKRAKYLDIIVAESERLSGLIENVLDFAKVERGTGSYEFSEGDVGDAVLRAVAVYKYRAEREGVDLVVDVTGPLPSSRLDERALQLAIINLVDNALKYAKEGKVITIGAAVASSATPPRIEIRVTDEGPGVPKDERLRIFERFVRGGGSAGRSSSDGEPVRGSGIGLSLVKHIAESHGGDAFVESEVGRGSTFVIALPLARQGGRDGIELGDAPPPFRN